LKNRRTIGRPFKKGQGGRPKGALNKKTIERNLLTRAAELVDGAEYFDNVKQRILRGRAPHMETYFAQRLHGRAVDSSDDQGASSKPIKVVIEVVRG